jgi:hypothetical protein
VDGPACGSEKISRSCSSRPTEPRHGASSGEIASVAALARAQEAWHREQLARYQGIVDRFGDRPDLARRVATARAGVADAHAFVDFWADIAANPPEVPPPAAPRRGVPPRGRR